MTSTYQSFYHMLNHIDDQYATLVHWHAFICNNLDIAEWQRKGLIDDDDYARLREYNRECMMQYED